MELLVCYEIRLTESGGHIKGDAVVTVRSFTASMVEGLRLSIRALVLGKTTYMESQLGELIFRSITKLEDE